MRIIAWFESTVGKRPLGLVFGFWNTRWEPLSFWTRWRQRVTYFLSTCKQILCMEDPQDQVLVMSRSSLFFFCREKAGVTALTVFKVNILWKLRNAQLTGNTVGFYDIFSCFNFRACVWIFICKSEVDGNPYTRDGYAAAGDQQCKLWGLC